MCVSSQPENPKSYYEHFPRLLWLFIYVRRCGLFYKLAVFERSLLRNKSSARGIPLVWNVLSRHMSNKRTVIKRANFSLTDISASGVVLQQKSYKYRSCLEQLLSDVSNTNIHCLAINPKQKQAD